MAEELQQELAEGRRQEGGRARRPVAVVCGPVPQMRVLCRSAGGVVSGAVSQLCRQTYGR
ncbi:hypothetical protein ACH4A7_36540 [Streptomyces cyaneofuscatus]|uniref:hypothetical protein n=1 Tax=Streptomyces cyaneofuscatus TaxID=66883 RepID=UPI00378D7381